MRSCGRKKKVWNSAHSNVQRHQKLSIIRCNLIASYKYQKIHANLLCSLDHDRRHFGIACGFCFFDPFVSLASRIVLLNFYWSHLKCELSSEAQIERKFSTRSCKWFSAILWNFISSSNSFDSSTLSPLLLYILSCSFRFFFDCHGGRVKLKFHVVQVRK